MHICPLLSLFSLPLPTLSSLTPRPHSLALQVDMYNFNMSLPPGRTYRYYTGTPLFAFGTGMSYTRFHLSTVTDNVTLACTVQNQGGYDGDEVVRCAGLGKFVWGWGGKGGRCVVCV